MAVSTVTDWFKSINDPYGDWTDDDNIEDGDTGTYGNTTVDEGLFSSSQVFTSHIDINAPNQTGSKIIYGDNWEAQIFQASSSYTINQVMLQMSKSGSPTGNFTVGIYATDISDQPTGSALCSAAIAASLIGSLAFIKIPFSSGASLTSGNKYAIVVSYASGDVANYIRWCITGNTYSNGNRCYSANAGSSWNDDTSDDFIFATYEDLHENDYITKIEFRAYGYGDGDDEWWIGWDTDLDEYFNNITSLSSPSWTDWVDVTFYDHNLTDANSPYTVYEYCDDAGTGYQNAYSTTNKVAQIFTPDTNHTIDWIRIYAQAYSNPVGDLNVDIYETKGIVDSFSETNQDTYLSADNLHPSSDGYASSLGQTFTNTNQGKILSAKFYLKKYGSPTGTAHAVLYNITGTSGSTGMPTGSALATSDGFDISTLSSSVYTLVEFTFSGSEQYTMTGSIDYCIAFENPTSGTIDTDNYVQIGSMGVGSDDGNRFYYNNSSWSYTSGADICFYVYGDNATTDLVPNGSAIASGSLSVDYFEITPDWVNMPLNETTELTNGKQYIMVFSSPDSDSDGYYNILFDNSGTYSAGNMLLWETDTWVNYSSYDVIFYEGSNWWNWDDVVFTYLTNGDQNSNMAGKLYFIHNDVSKGGTTYVSKVELRVTYITIEGEGIIYENVSDTITLTENTLGLGASLNVSDSVGLAESYAFQMDTSLDDTITLTENAIQSILMFYESLSDTVTLTEDTILQDISLYYSDIITLADSLYKDIATSETDTITITEDSLLKTIGNVISDTVTLTEDTILKSIDLIKSDTITLTEDTLSKVVGMILSDTITLTEDTIDLAFILALSDTITLTEDALDVQKFAGIINEYLSDTITITEDALVKITGIVETDTITLTEDSLLKNVANMLSDTITLTEDTILKDLSTFATDTITLTEDTLLKTIGILESDIITLTEDTITKSVINVLSDTITLTEDTLDILKAILKSISDTITLTEDSLINSIGIIETDTITLTEDAILQDISLFVTDTITLTEDTIDTLVAIFASISDTITLTEDTITKSVVLIKSDNITLTEDNLLKSIFEVLSDTITITEDTLGVITLLFETLSDTITLTENTLIKSIDKILSDTITLTEDALIVQKIGVLYEYLEDTITLTEDSLVKTITTLLSDTVTLAEVLLNITMFSVLSDTVTLTEDNLTLDVSLTKDDTITLNDILSYSTGLLDIPLSFKELNEQYYKIDSEHNQYYKIKPEHEQYYKINKK